MCFRYNNGEYIFLEENIKHPIIDLNYAGIVKDDNSWFRTKDLANSFGNVNCYFSIYKENNNVYIYLEINDIYDFHLFNSKGEFIDNPINTWAEYYQSRGYGNVYEWKLYNYDKIN